MDDTCPPWLSDWQVIIVFWMYDLAVTLSTCLYVYACSLVMNVKVVRSTVLLDNLVVQWKKYVNVI